MPVYQRPGSPYYWYNFSIDGERFRGSTKQTNERKALLAEAELYQQAKNRAKAVDEWRLREVLGAYWNEHAQHVKSSSDIFFQFELLSEFIGRDTPAKDITNAKILDYRAARRGGQITLPAASIEARPKSWQMRIIEEGRKEGQPGKVKGVAPQTVNRDIAHLKAAMNWAQNMHGKPMPTLAWKHLQAAEAPYRIRFAAAAEFDALLTAAHEDLRPIILAAVTTGLRRANILKLEWHQVDLVGSTITISTSKGNKPGVVQIAPPLRAALARTPGAMRKGRVFTTTNFKRRWAAALKAANMVDFHFHDLRHTFASWARQNGADLADICEALMHSSVSVTMRYAHIRPGEDVTAFDRVAALFATPEERKDKRA